MRICTVVGARPQFIKAAAFSRVARATPGVEEFIVHTGQHYDGNMSAVFFEEMGIPEPQYNLAIGSGGHGAQTGRMLAAIEEILVERRPDWLLVYGDTNSTLAGALAAAKLHIPVAHVEAGLRSFNRRMPEEVNRVLTDHASDLLFAPTATAVENLRREGMPEARIRLSGDVMYDAALYYGARARAESRILDRLGLTPGGFVLATVHRAENTDDPARLAAVFGGLAGLAEQAEVVLPLHPRTRAALERSNLRIPPRLRLIDPVGYLDMVMLEQSCRLIATDSGGVQKEAFFFGVPCATLRDETEWVELVELGWNRLVPPTAADAVAAGLLAALAGRPTATAHPYGRGDAARLIIDVLAGQGPSAGKPSSAGAAT
ncbi:MAG TPA: UDP-N-acetylglucosamine 2-epimerase (non-hydrolyzing) [Alphaproteobacteria bacterium]|nr:UDP-N-acetylglucosamine 2-epimerase (non-hydrolyzing) [Alphaproteobacteria bacterium]